jgi:hypothetical protein
MRKLGEALVAEAKVLERAIRKETGYVGAKKKWAERDKKSRDRIIVFFRPPPLTIL